MTWRSKPVRKIQSTSSSFSSFSKPSAVCMIMRSSISLRTIFRVRDIQLFCLQRMPIHRTSDAGIAVSIPLLKLRANFWIKVRVHQLVRIGLSSFRGERICLHSLQKEKVSRIAKKVRRNEENSCLPLLSATRVAARSDVNQDKSC